MRSITIDLEADSFKEAKKKITRVCLANNLKVPGPGRPPKRLMQLRDEIHGKT